MRLSEEEVRRIAIKIVSTWKEKNLVEVTKSDAQLLSFLEATFIKDFKAEDDLNKEVEGLLKKYEAQISDTMDRQKMFKMVKNQLIKERKLVI